MRALLVFTALFILTGQTLAGKTGELKIYVKDPLGAPVVSAKVELGDRSMLTDYYGVVIFDEVVRNEYVTLKISDSEGIYLPFEKTIKLEDRSNNRYYKLEWTPSQWEKYFSTFRIKRLEEIQKLIDATDYSKLAACEDTTGEHQYIEAEFPGGVQMLQSFINANVMYPEESIDMEEQGKVYLSFVVEADGQITELDVDKGVSRSLDAEAKRCVRLMPLWVNGFCNGVPKRTKVFLPIVFTLQ